MAELLELRHFADEHAMAEMQIRGRGIEARLDPEGPALHQFGFKLLDLVAGHGALREQGEGSRQGSGSSSHACILAEKPHGLNADQPGSLAAR
jgi:hypothetical protein